MLLVLISIRAGVDPRAIVRLEGFYVDENARQGLTLMQTVPYECDMVWERVSVETRAVE
jgi:hypothetical protein